MLLKNYFYYFKKAFSKKFCEDVIQLGASKQKKIAQIGGGPQRDEIRFPLDKSELKALRKTRDSNISWLTEPWIYKRITPYIHEANKRAGWDYQWEDSESCQFTKYDKGQYYDWHCDSSEEPYKDGDKKGKIRKLSVTISLSDSSEYKGGNLQFAYRNKMPTKKEKIYTCKEILEQGSIIIFPSFVWHKVSPVTKGTRYSLVVWNVGEPFK